MGGADGTRGSVRVLHFMGPNVLTRWNPEDRLALTIETWVSYCAGRRWEHSYRLAIGGNPVSPPSPPPARRRWPPHQRAAVAAKKWAAYCAGRAWKRKYLAALAAPP